MCSFIRSCLEAVHPEEPTPALQTKGQGFVTDRKSRSSDRLSVPETIERRLKIRSDL